MFTRPRGIAFKRLLQEAPEAVLPRRIASLIVGSIVKGAAQVGRAMPCSSQTVALAAALALSALFTVVALRVPGRQGLAWISFLPLFAVVRSLRPPAAALAGGFWGVCLYLLVSAGANPAIGPSAHEPSQASPSVWLLALLIAIPAVYVGLAARPTRRSAGVLSASSANRLFTLALGWTLIEVVLHLFRVSGPQEGLLTGATGEGESLHWFARLLGYVCSAFAVACINASLVGFLSGLRLTFPALRPSAKAPSLVGRLPMSVSIAIQSWNLRQVYPRGPPVRL